MPLSVSRIYTQHLIACSDDACVGYSSCEYLGIYNMATVEDQACRGEGSCYKASGVEIKSSSCIGYHSCYYFNDQGYDDEPLKAIGASSCVGPQSCLYLDGDVGSGSCFGGSACRGAVFEDEAATVGDGACIGYKACFFIHYLPGENWIIEDGACIGDYSCSCAEVVTAYSSTYIIPKGACTEEDGNRCCPPK